MNLKHPVSNGAVQVSRDQMLALSRPPSPYPLVIKSDILAYTPSPPLYLITWTWSDLDPLQTPPSPLVIKSDILGYLPPLPPRAAPVPVTNILIIK